MTLSSFKMSVFLRRKLGRNQSKNLFCLGLAANLFGLQESPRQAVVPSRQAGRKISQVSEAWGRSAHAPRQDMNSVPCVVVVRKQEHSEPSRGACSGCKFFE